MKMPVVYFDQLLGAVRTQKLVKLLFSAIFNLFCSFQAFFSEINKIRLKKNKRNVFLYTLRAGRLPEGVPRNCLFRLIFSKKNNNFGVPPAQPQGVDHLLHVDQL